MAKKIQPKKKAAARKAPAAPKKTEREGLSLPTLPKEVEDHILYYSFLIYGREKIGKTTLAASFPNAIFFSTEPGIKGLAVFSFNEEGGGITEWRIFKEGVRLLCEIGPKKFKAVVVDTVDRLYDLCLDHVCKERGIPYPGETASGENDYGKSWKAVKDEFAGEILKLSRAGFGLVFISHAKEVTTRTRSGEKFDRIYPTMSNQARSMVEAFVDFMFYAEYVKDMKGQERRILVCRGDELIFAGARPTPSGEDFPRFLELKRKGGFDVIDGAFRGEEKGIEPSEILPSRNTAETTKAFLRKAKKGE